MKAHHLSVFVILLMQKHSIQCSENNTTTGHQSTRMTLIVTVLSNKNTHKVKVATLIYKVSSSQQPAYLYNVISYHQSSCLLHFCSQCLLHVPRIKSDFGRRAVSCAAQRIWNHIPTAVRVSPSLDFFKLHLKTH